MVIEDWVNNLKRCTKCILPETFPGISFDEHGICNYCNDYKKVEVKGEEELGSLLSKYRGKGKKYDCIVPVSGGRDSSYVLHQMVKKYDMRVLALTVDNGAIMPEGYRNIDVVTKALEINHVWLKNEDQIKTSQNNVKIKFNAWLKKPSINTIVPVLNAGDKTMNLRMYKYAHDNSIPLVIGGNNTGNSSLEQEHFKTGFMGIFPDERGRYTTFDKIRLFINFGWEFIRNTNNYHWSIFKEYLTGSLVYFFESIQKPKDVIPVGFYDYIYWNEKQVVSTVKELGWKGASDTLATWRIDDSAYPLIDYIYYSLVGFNEFDEHYSKLVREGQLTREEALNRLVTDRLRIPSMKASLKEMNIDEIYFDKVIKEYNELLLENILKG
ncbi:MAG: phosphoadenosine phosphosulfate reductase family protein [Candidatus Bathyarchaeota archaeon]|nr:phosphoadenosine phosphosulfate reductase family protein [Candidatus Bathyarchaeota archaeon]